MWKKIPVVNCLVKTIRQISSRDRRGVCGYNLSRGKGDLSMRGGGMIIAIILGVILGFRALFRLFKMRMYIRFGLYFVIWFGYPIVAYNLFGYLDQIDNVHIKIWGIMPLLIAGLTWLFFGLMMNKKVENIKLNINYQDKYSRTRRIIGIIMCVVAFLTWISGLNSYFGESESFDILGSLGSTMLFCFGALYLTGKPFSKIDD
ncbi:MULTISPECIES: hypothetical protein [unclassified Paenibacillus]|uniref:hypothetical protein n=1 Tax=unclassified Paenibacillus TaxID=185978 RepID=UPI002787C4C4|nr:MULTISPECIES: hypothetical protein [unclassified Paenibacillus]MDQ0896297.1 hypothetical protein [Paenibacillus sp. V4I7]MDQ0913775.1 hypothetical protein [Paenibacillus sp. V4I5]